MSRFLTLSAGLLLAAAASASTSEPLVICYEDQHFPPYILGTSGQVAGHGGIIYDYIEQSAALLEHPVVFERKPWKRCQVELQHGDVDAMFATIYTEERDAWAAFPKTDGVPDDRYLHFATYPVFVPMGSELSWNGEAFSPEKPLVQSVPGYVSEKKLLAMGMRPITALLPREALPLVATGRLDGYVLEEQLGRELARQMGLEDNITTLPIPFLEQPWYLAFSKQRYAQDPELVETFWTILMEVRETLGPSIIKRYTE